MTTTATPFGFAPVGHPSGTVRIETLTDGVASGYATAIYENAPIKRDTNGSLTVAAAGEACIGVFAGCEFTSGSKRYVQNYWTASQTYDAGSCLVHYTWDKAIIYQVQGTGSFAQTAIGDCSDLVGTSGDAVTGISSSALGAVQGGTAQFQIIQLAQQPDNAWGDTYTIVRVQIYEYQGVV